MKKVKKKQNKKGFWFVEKFTPHEKHSHHLKKYLIRKKTKFQKAIVAEAHSFGKCLILDGEMQSAQADEYIYHEALVHPALLSHPHPKKILIIGGGEGATLREVLKYKTVKNTTMVDIDKEVIDFCKKYLYEWHLGSFNDRRVKILYQDARKYVVETKEKFDVIISDLPCPIRGGPAYLLYTSEFYKIVKSKLLKKGIFLLQAGSVSIPQIHLHSILFRTLKRIFKIVKSYNEFIPSFDVPWGFIFTSDWIDPQKINSKEINKRIKKRIKGKLKFYDGRTHEGIFNIPKNIREILEKERRVSRDKKPVFFYK